jgi:hypothetical protein
MSCGGSMKKMQKGGMIKSIIKPFAKKVVKKITKPTTPKMAVGGTTTKRIIKKSTGGMYGIPQENLGTSGQYGFAQKGGTVKKYQKGGYTVTNKDGSPMTTPEGYRPPGVPSYPDFKKLRKTDPGNIAFMQIAKNPEEFDPKDVKKYGAKKPSRRMIREMSKESESAPMQTTPYKKGGATKTLPKAQLGAIIGRIAKFIKPASKVVKTTTKKFKVPITDKMKTRVVLNKQVAKDVKKYNSETNPLKLAERKTMKEQMKQWDKAAELKQQKKYPVLKNKN